MLSALQHYNYCPRQCALIHIEQVFDENVHTMRGNAMHQRVDEPEVESFEGMRTEHALPVWSERLGLIGKCDVGNFILMDVFIQLNTNMEKNVQKCMTIFNSLHRLCVWRK